MHIASIVFISTWLVGCAAQHDQLVATCSDDFDPNISVTRLSSDDGIAEYELQSNEDCLLTYFHWLTQGPDPVPYCKSDGNVWMCATEVFGIEDTDGNFVELTHETRLYPGEKVSFHVRQEGASEIGIRFWSYAQGKDVYVWSVIGE